MRAIDSPGVRMVLGSFAMYLATALATHASGLWQPMHADYSCWLRVSREWNEGAVLYRETYDNKSPWLYRWVGAIDSSRPELSCYLAESVLAAIGASFLRVALRQGLRTVATLAPLLLIVWSGCSETFYGAQTTEAFGLWLEVTAIACCAMAARRGSSIWGAAGGMLLFVDLTFRPVALLHGLACLPFVWLLFLCQPRHVAIRTLAAAVAGFVLTLGLFCLDLGLGGFGAEYLDVLTHNKSYAALNHVGLTSLMAATASTLARIGIGNACALLLMTLSAVVGWRSLYRQSRQQRAWRSAALLWLIAAIVSTLPGGRSYAHYYHFIWAPISLLSVFWLAAQAGKMWAGALHRRLVIGVAAGVCLVAGLQQGLPAAKALRDMRSGEHSRDLIDQAASYLAETTTSQTPVVIHVWGEWAELYWRVRRPAPSFSMPHVLPKELFERWASTTLAQPPPFIVWDGTPWQSVDESADPLLVRRLTDLVHGEYKAIKRFGKLTILKRATP